MKSDKECLIGILFKLPAMHNLHPYLSYFSEIWSCTLLTPAPCPCSLNSMCSLSSSSSLGQLCSFRDTSWKCSHRSQQDGLLKDKVTKKSCCLCPSPSSVFGASLHLSISMTRISALFAVTSVQNLEGLPASD